jgi:hypothetical protein
MRDGLGIDSPRMDPGRLTKVLTPGDWDKPLNGVLFGLWPHTRAFRTSESADFSEVRVRKFRTLKTLVCLRIYTLKKSTFRKKNPQHDVDQQLQMQRQLTLSNLKDLTRAFRTSESESADFSEVLVRKFRTLKTLRTRTQHVCLFTHLYSKEVNISPKISEISIFSFLFPL